jgi:hypothetical protein
MPTRRKKFALANSGKLDGKTLGCKRRSCFLQKGLTARLWSLLPIYKESIPYPRDYRELPGYNK